MRAIRSKEGEYQKGCLTQSTAHHMHGAKQGRQDAEVSQYAICGCSGNNSRATGSEMVGRGRLTRLLISDRGCLILNRSSSFSWSMAESRVRLRTSMLTLTWSQLSPDYDDSRTLIQAERRE